MNQGFMLLKVLILERKRDGGSAISLLAMKEKNTAISKKWMGCTMTLGRQRKKNLDHIFVGRDPSHTEATKMKQSHRHIKRSLRFKPSLVFGRALAMLLLFCSCANALMAFCRQITGFGLPWRYFISGGFSVLAKLHPLSRKLCKDEKSEKAGQMK
jgi:hypothetical protein